MNTIKAVIFDADGVIVKPPQLFSQFYAQKYGYDVGKFTAFFKGEFGDAITGKADLKDLLRKHHEIWQWDKDPQELLDMWFEAENHLDPAVMDYVKKLHAQGMPIYLASNQEKYRAQYFRDTVFPDTFDDMFFSSDIGCMKRDSDFWKIVLQKLEEDIPGIQPAEIIFFDDSQDSVDGAQAAGINAHLYAGVEVLTKELS